MQRVLTEANPAYEMPPVLGGCDRKPQRQGNPKVGTTTAQHTTELIQEPLDKDVATQPNASYMSNVNVLQEEANHVYEEASHVYEEVQWSILSPQHCY